MLANGGHASTDSAPAARRHFLSDVAFPIFAWGLALHSLLMAALFGWFGLPQETVRVLAAWKEAGLAFLLILVALRSVTGRGRETRLAWPDIWIGALMATAILFLMTENLWLRFDLPRSAELFGIRDSVFFMLAYFVGRASPELATDEKSMKRLFILVTFTCVVGIVERFAITPEMLVALGVASYFQTFLGVGAFTLGNEYGLPLNYWAGIGGKLVRRAGSVYLGGQGFAAPFLLLFPLSTSWVFLREKRSKILVACYVIICAGLLLTLTRMTIIVALLQVTLFVALRRRAEWAVAGLVMAFIIFAIVFILIPGFPVFVWHTISFQESSSVSHMNDWSRGLAALAQNPWGSGLGTTDQTAVRAGLRHITGDNLYFKYAVELGIAGITFFILILTWIGMYAMRLLRTQSLPSQRMGMTVGLATIGIALNGMTAVVFNSITLGWLFFWLAGAVVTAADELPGNRA